MTRPDLSRALERPPGSPDTGPGAAVDRGADRERLVQLAAEFESMLMLEMIKQMRQSLLGDDEREAGLGADTFTSTIDTELAGHLARAGGLGLQQMMVGAWDRQHGDAPAPGHTAPVRSLGIAPALAAAAYERTAVPVAPPTTPISATRTDAGAPVSAARSPGVNGTTAAREPERSLHLDMQARVSSPYGWRHDPFHGHARFHGGIDLAAREGTPVPSAAGGTVVTAGEQGAYGLTVVVRHPGGYESRYAHLSGIDVSVGETIGKGTVVGKVGTTGRSTAPHLHFEVTRGGQRIDPGQFVRNLTSDTKGQ
jgi:murein DD-endopeptidase MepM/ murein hydrolase activator NlpD